jgi:MFS family permease
MPEILPPHLLSRGNGLLESLSFLAVILGTVAGGVLSSEFLFKGREYYIGLILVGLAVVGAVASLLIHAMPAANPNRPFPSNQLKPVWENLRVLLSSRALTLAVLGIAFFTFVVAFMRATVYMLGESHVPRWSEFKTSVIVGMSALGIGLGSPLAGYLSGGRVELRLVPVGACGMIAAAASGAFLLHWLPGLIASIILIGFFTGFFIVPLFTLLQHRAPKASKGESIATSNFINVVGAITASVLFFALVNVAQRVGVVPSVPQQDLFTGRLVQLTPNRHGRPAYFKVETPAGSVREVGERRLLASAEDEEWWWEEEEPDRRIEVEEDLINVFGRLHVGSDVTVSTYTLPATNHRPQPLTYYKLREASQPQRPAYDNEDLPRYLFFGAGAMTLGILLVLWRPLRTTRKAEEAAVQPV